MISREQKQKEVDKNYDVFVKKLPELKEKHQGEYALISQGRIIEFFLTFEDAQKAGLLLTHSNGLFSIQKVEERVIDLGFYSYA